MRFHFHIAFLALVVVAVSPESSVAQQDRTAGYRTTTDSTDGVSSSRVRRRIQELRGTPGRVIYPIIIVTGGDSLAYESPEQIAEQRAIQQRLSRLPGYGIDPVTGRAIRQPGLPDSLLGDGGVVDSVAVEQAVAEIVARNQLVQDDARSVRDANIALANQIAALRAQLAASQSEARRLERDQEVSNRLLTNRVAALERELALLMAGMAVPREPVRDTVVVSRSDTVRQIIEQQPRVDTVVVIREPGPPTVVEIERALLDEGLFQTVDVLFEFNKAALLPASKNVLASVAEVLRTHSEIQIQVGGHTDSSGPDAYNQTLSERRAQSVLDYLVNEERIPADRLSAVGYGESQPTASNATSTGRALNRRVAFKVVHDE